MVAGSP